MQKAVALKAGQLIGHFNYSFSLGQIIEYEYSKGMVRFATIRDPKGNDMTSTYQFHKAIEDGDIERQDE